MVRAVIKGIFVLSLVISSLALTYQAYFNSPKIVLSASKEPLKFQNYSNKISPLMEKLFFYKDLKNLYKRKTYNLKNALKTIQKYEGNLSYLESFYLESCFLTLNKDTELEECERLLYKGIHHISNTWKIPIVMGMICAFKYKDLKKASLFFNLALSKNTLPNNLRLFPVIDTESLVHTTLGLRIKSLLHQASKDLTINKYRISLKKAILSKESSSNASPDYGNQKHREVL